MAPSSKPHNAAASKSTPASSSGITKSEPKSKSSRKSKVKKDPANASPSFSPPESDPGSLTPWGTIPNPIPADKTLISSDEFDGVVDELVAKLAAAGLGKEFERCACETALLRAIVDDSRFEFTMDKLVKARTETNIEAIMRDMARINREVSRVERSLPSQP